MNKNYKIVLLITMFIVFIPTHAQFMEDENIPTLLRESPVDSHLLKLVAALSEQAHFSKQKVNNELSPFILINFLEKLDPVKMYFTRSDIRYFQRYRFKIDNALKQGDLEPIYDIFRIYRLRVQQRLSFCITFLLNQEHNFESDNSYDFNYQAKNWPNENETSLTHQHKILVHTHTHGHGDEHHVHKHISKLDSNAHEHEHEHEKIVHKHEFVIDLHHQQWPKG